MSVEKSKRCCPRSCRQRASYSAAEPGDRFISLANSRQIGNVYFPNALVTLYEYSMDYGDGSFKEKASCLIANEIANIADGKTRERVVANVERIRSSGEHVFFGERDFFV